jgi:hypothetical protein
MFLTHPASSDPFMHVRVKAALAFGELYPETSMFNQRYPLTSSMNSFALVLSPQKFSGLFPIAHTSCAGTIGCKAARGSASCPPLPPLPPPPPPPPVGGVRFRPLSKSFIKNSRTLGFGVGVAGVAVVVWAACVVVVLIVVCVMGLSIPRNLTVVAAKWVTPCMGLFLIWIFRSLCLSSLLLSLPLLLICSGSLTSGGFLLGPGSYLSSGRSNVHAFMNGYPNIGCPSLSSTLNQILY